MIDDLDEEERKAIVEGLRLLAEALGCPGPGDPHSSETRHCLCWACLKGEDPWFT
jgi:hypothetical protein